MNRSPLRSGFFTLAIALCCCVLSPLVQAQCPTFCDGGAGGNTALGVNALSNVTAPPGINNTAVGFNALSSNTTGFYNVAIGSGALENNVDGDFNMAIGAESLKQNNASFNLAIGFRTLFQNTTGRHNTGIGAAAMRNNTIGEFNTAIGADAMRENTIAGTNTAIGAGALTLNTTTEFNVAVGDSALGAFNGTDPVNDGANTALGSLSLTALTGGTENVAVGRRSLEALTNGHNNTVIGWRAGDNYSADESNNILIGSQTNGVSGDNGAIRIGTNVSSAGINIVNNGGAANSITIGVGNGSGGITVLETLLGSTISIGANLPNPGSTAFMGGIFNVPPPAGSHLVMVAANGQLSDATASSRQFKKDIAPMDKASEGILALKPVTFHFKNDDTNYPQFGLIAEDVAKVNPDWITRDPKGEVYGVRYETIPVLLLNEFLKEHKKVEDQQASIADLKSTVALQQKEVQVLTAQLKEQAAQIQRVSAQLEASKPAPKVVSNK